MVLALSPPFQDPGPGRGIPAAGSTKTFAAPDDVTYFLPFESGFTAQVSKGNGDLPDHENVWNRYAFDFSPLPEGTPVVAAADGVVMLVKDDTAGPTGDVADNNVVILRHRDGTFTEYAHLKKDGVRVEVDQLVLGGDVIAESGNTGNSTAPHLHFGRRTESGLGASIPTRFADLPGDGVPRSGDTVISRNGCVRELPEFRELQETFALADLCEEIGVFEPLVPRLAAAKRITFAPGHDALRGALARRDELLVAQKRRAGVQSPTGDPANAAPVITLTAPETDSRFREQLAQAFAVLARAERAKPARAKRELNAALAQWRTALELAPDSARAPMTRYVQRLHNGHLGEPWPRRS